jgi:hypothetical protein
VETVYLVALVAVFLVIAVVAAHVALKLHADR